MKRLLSVIVPLLIVFCLPVRVHAESAETSARAYALYCADNGELLLSENPDERLPMASTTKIMTALITLEIAAKEDRVVEFTEEMTAEGSSMYLTVGEKVRLSDLAVGMLMQSGNDAANAAAIAIDGSTKRFALRMNRRAAEIGLDNTHFVTPSGLDDRAHYSTARDLAKLMAYAMENDSFRKLTAQKSAAVDFVEPSGKRVIYPNHNRLLSLYEDCIGGKTGYTQTAGRCLVSAAERDGLTLIAVTLDDRDDWDDHMKLYERGFEDYAAITPEKTTEFRIPVVGGTSDEAAVYAKKNACVVAKKDRIGDVRTSVSLPPFLYAPVERNAEVGTLVYSLDGKTLGEIPLLSADTIAYDSRRRGFFEYISDVLGF